jgi:ubiquinone/menaquinone biosynthesis C-methylase UbiE
MAQAATTWGIGDYPLMAAKLEPVASVAVLAGAVGPGVRVLDLATGTGNAALVAAELGAVVTAVDIEPVLIELAERRSRSAAVDIRWLLGDLEHLPVPDASADVVLSIFGVMYAADHPVAARELARVTAPGGRVVLASWQPGSFMPAMGQVIAEFLPPPPPNSGPPSRWGDAGALSTIFHETDLQIVDTIAGQVVLTFADATTGALFLITTAGHILSERERLMRLGTWGDLQDSLAKLVSDRGEPSDDGIEIKLDYLMATVVKPESS